MPLLIEEYLERGPATSKEIQAVTGMSQSVVARRLRSMGSRIVKLRSGRTLRYAVTCNAFGGDDKLPLSIVDVYGNTVPVAVIRPLAHGGFFVEASAGMPSLLFGVSNDGLYGDLPYFLFDLRPQGFLGRQVAREMASRFDDFPPDPRNWNTNHIGRYLISNGDDLPGNFKFGGQALLRVRRQPVIVSDRDYPDLADSVMRGVVPGSSAGGEQPKFTAFSGHSLAHVIVKFSPQEDNSITRRWRDILITEYHAAEVIRNYDFPAAETRLIEMGDRLFLESKRFDRFGEFGRKLMVSLQSVDAEFTGLGRGWLQVLDALSEQGLIGEQDVFDVAILKQFGLLINNTDMHLGNISLAMEGGVFRLLPLYDMCSMGFAPKSGGELPPYNFIPSESAISSNVARKMAHDFWERVTNDERISDELKGFLGRGNPACLMKKRKGPVTC
ncbi:MAG: type II toxin-antitoxin system HipA family toxin YjjJ [Pseudomonadota bacterium]|nr:type II toxin-antitoxin system HipA family toxin YjjJ [Pseudomonadota bacterium]